MVEYRSEIERAVSAGLRRHWRMDRLVDLRDLACHPAAILSGEGYAVFVKFSNAAHGLEQFEVELAGLRYLGQHAGVLTPVCVAALPVDSGSLLILEAAEAVERDPQAWRQIGQTLARIHLVKGSTCGFDRQGFFGPLYQDNRPLASWSEFFAERRLWPRLMGAIDSGHLSSGLINKLERLILRLPDFCGPDPVPSLLHGDAQQNNYISTAHGAMVIDPAVCYGHPEFDLAFVDYFQPVPPAVFEGYREILPIDAGFTERKALWRIYGYLAAVTVEGGEYIRMLTDAVDQYIR
ncbi:MAG: fructosamine kinase family protein [Anaerolineae bacterium]|nr:fructosamine kinase family protein [Anaerolineae bacterium]